MVIAMPALPKSLRRLWLGTKKTPAVAPLMLRQAFIKTPDHSHAAYSVWPASVSHCQMSRNTRQWICCISCVLVESASMITLAVKIVRHMAVAVESSSLLVSCATSLCRTYTRARSQCLQSDFVVIWQIHNHRPAAGRTIENLFHLFSTSVCRSYRIFAT